MPNEPLYRINGRLVPKSQATIHVSDHGFLFGDGVFEGLRIFGGRLFALDAHLDRLIATAAEIDLTIPEPREKLRAALEETVVANQRRTGYVRVIVSRGLGTLGLDPRKCDTNVLILVDEIRPYPLELVDFGISVLTASRPRPEPARKTLNYAVEAWAHAEALRRGVSEALLTNTEGALVGAAGANLFIGVAGELMTPSRASGAFPGITRETLLSRSTAQEVVLHRDLLDRADEAFLTCTTAGVVPIVRIDGRTLGRGEIGPLTEKARQWYREAVQ